EACRPRSPVKPPEGCMSRRRATGLFFKLALGLIAACGCATAGPAARETAPLPGSVVTVPAQRRTSVAISGDSFLLNGRPTYAGRSFRGARVDGLLMNARMVQGI